MNFTAHQTSCTKAVQKNKTLRFLLATSASIM
jgi:hypothetical protein